MDGKGSVFDAEAEDHYDEEHRLLHYKWVGGKRVAVVEEPKKKLSYDEEVDCRHWEEIVDALGGENTF